MLHEVFMLNVFGYSLIQWPTHFSKEQGTILVSVGYKKPILHISLCL